MERHYFERIKEACVTTVLRLINSSCLKCMSKIHRFALAATTSASARDGWTEFLKCIDLFSQDLVQRLEMLLLTTELFTSRGLEPIYDHLGSFE